MESGEEKPGKPYRYLPNYSKETAETIFRLRITGLTIAKIAVEVGTSEYNVGNLCAGTSRAYPDLYPKYAALLPKIQKHGPIERPLGYFDDGFRTSPCNSSD